MINDMLFSLKKTNNQKLLGFGNKPYLNKLIYTPSNNSNINKNLKNLFNTKIQEYYNFINNEKLINNYNYNKLNKTQIKKN
jgi:hypothetical protein